MESKVKSINERNLSHKLKLRKLSLSIGQFIRYWGFRRVHGAIWTQLYLSETALSCTDLAKQLGLSKALISPALDELCQYKLIVEAPAPNEKSKVYVASENINEVIQNVLKNREAIILREITQDFSSLSESESVRQTTNPAKLKNLGEMILAAHLMLEMMMNQKNILTMPLELSE